MRWPPTLLSWTALAALASLLLAPGAAAGAVETPIDADGEAFLCATPEDHYETLDPLAKRAALPSITKVYSGKSIAVVVKIAFSNAAYTVADSTLNKTHASVNSLFRSMSRSTFEFDFKVHPEIWTAPGTKEEYSADFSSLQSFIASKLRENGYTKISSSNPNGNYTVFVANFPRIGVNWAGLSNGSSGGGNYINGSYSSGVTAHELGHAVGLPHAHSIEAGSDAFGTPGTSSQHVEYGNPYDVMGNAGGLGHFNVNYKWRTGWIDKEEALEVKSSGVYRIYAHDNPVHKGRMLGIRVSSMDTRYAYWFEYRAANTYARAGAEVLFEGFQGITSRSIHILDMTPASRANSDAQDAVLAVGKEFKDKYGSATFRTLAINSGTWSENGWVDLQVTLPGSELVTLGRPASLPRPSAGTGADLDILGRTLGAALPAQALVVKSGRVGLSLSREAALAP
ncbi:MAG TPA: hypothetical protein VK465_07785 [Fibrobacteria bacterium]|nr:hypothetical protein [Fibrobacteria bacterium]